jgi:RNA methyltransferase, TrmH family
MLTRKIDSPKNPLIKALLRLKERRHRDREGRYLIEGVTELRRALTAGVPVETVLIAPAYLSADARHTLETLGNLSLSELSEDAFKRLSFRQTPDGIMAVARVQPVILTDVQLSENPLLLIVDGVEKPGNLGALLRTADATNCDMVILTGGGTDIYNPNVIRSSVGSLFSRPVVQTDREQAIAFCRQHHIQLIASSPAAEADYWNVGYTTGVAIVLGTEHEGLSQTWFEAADTKVSIPMLGLADSLNVATSGALLLYEVLRQRQASIRKQ